MGQSKRQPFTVEDDVSYLNACDQSEQAKKDVIHARLQARCEVDEQTGCWVFTGYWSDRGQGNLRVGRRVYTLPRIAAWLYIEGFHLEDPRWVYRKCDCNACFNPAHILVAKSRAEALAQLRALGRFGCGFRKLNQDIANGLRAAYAHRPADCDRAGFIRRQAKALGVRPQAVRNILDNRSWIGG